MLQTANIKSQYKNVSPAKKARSMKRLVAFQISTMSKLTDTSALSICPQQMQSVSPSKPNLTITNLPAISIPPDPPNPFNKEDEIIMSELQPYCPECDHLFKREQVMFFREHCRVMHKWLWCENWHRGEGCELATTCSEELKKHMETCHIEANQPVT